MILGVEQVRKLDGKSPIEVESSIDQVFAIIWAQIAIQCIPRFGHVVCPLHVSSVEGLGSHCYATLQAASSRIAQVCQLLLAYSISRLARYRLINALVLLSCASSLSLAAVNSGAIFMARTLPNSTPH